MESSLKLVIVGAGIGGLACAIVSRHQGLDVLVLERTSRMTPIGAGIQIPPNASRVWAQYGILGELKRHSVISTGIQLRRWKDGKLLCERNIGEAMDERWPWLVIHRANYQRVLFEECERLGAKIRLGANVRDIEFDRTKVHLSNGETIRGDVIIGADGLSSTLRPVLLGHPSPPQETGDLAYRGTFKRSALQALGDAGIDQLCQRELSTMWIGPESHAVFYPVKCGNEFNLVITIPDDLPPDIKTSQGDVEEMHRVFSGWDEVFSKLLSGFSTVIKWKMMHHLELKSWTKNNVALLGDACHPSLPYQAQGAAMAVKDGVVLGTLLSQYHTSLHDPSNAAGPTLPETLRMYEALQKARTTKQNLGCISNQYLYHLPDGPEQEERDKILSKADWNLLPEDTPERFIWIDVRYQLSLLGWDCVGEALHIWKEVQGKNESEMTKTVG